MKKKMRKTVIAFLMVFVASSMFFGDITTEAIENDGVLKYDVELSDEDTCTEKLNLDKCPLLPIEVLEKSDGIPVRIFYKAAEENVLENCFLIWMRKVPVDENPENCLDSFFDSIYDRARMKKQINERRSNLEFEHLPYDEVTLKDGYESIYGFVLNESLQVTHYFKMPSKLTTGRYNLPIVEVSKEKRLEIETRESVLVDFINNRAKKSLLVPHDALTLIDNRDETRVIKIDRSKLSGDMKSFKFFEVIGSPHLDTELMELKAYFEDIFNGKKATVHHCEVNVGDEYEYNFHGRWSLLLLDEDREIVGFTTIER